MQIFITILVLVVMLGILIASHELGHLWMAKGFNIYCLEYSIGFGPRIFSFKRKNGETRYSLRLIPLGGFVSIYEEGVELPFGKKVPRSRSLEGVKPWKRALVMVAGVAVNLFLALLFTFIYALCFPSYYQSQALLIEHNGTTLQSYGLWVEGSLSTDDGELIYEFDSDKDRLYSPEIATDENLNQRGFTVDTNALIENDGEVTEAVAVYVYSNISSNPLYSSLEFYEPLLGFYADSDDLALGITAKADFSRPIALEPGDTVTLSLEIVHGDSRDGRPTSEQIMNRSSEVISLEVQGANFEGYLPSNNSPTITTLEFWPSFTERLANGCSYFVYFFEMIGLGLASIFTFNFSQLGSVVAMGGVLSQSSALIGWGRTFFMYGGYISLNLAIFNLLPIPGLDGWQLLVTFVEKVFKRKIPDKVKNVLTLIGFGLLLLLMVGLVFKDIWGLIG